MKALRKVHPVAFVSTANGLALAEIGVGVEGCRAYVARPHAEQVDASLSQAASHARQFREMVRQHQRKELTDWPRHSQEEIFPEELRSFAKGLQEDEPAVCAAFESPWSNGQVEGQVNRLKTLKRQMYGRAKFDLLRRRFLMAA